MLQLATFQSTGACNIAHVNAVNSIGSFARTKERGCALFKRSWAIEMNESRDLHLQTHGKVDAIDHMVKNCNLCYRLHHAKSCRPFELFANENHKLWNEAKMNATFERGSARDPRRSPLSAELNDASA